MDITIKKLNANDQINMQKDIANMFLYLSQSGMYVQDALSVAHNTAYIFYCVDFEEDIAKPLDLLTVFDLSQIAKLCEECMLVQNKNSESIFSLYKKGANKTNEF